MNYKELDKKVMYEIKNGNKISHIMRYLELKERATDKRTVEYKDSIQNTIDNQRKALEEAYAEIDRLKQSNERFVEKNTEQIKIIQDAHEANKRLAKEKEGLYILNIRHIADSQKDNEIMDKAVSKINQLKRANEELVKDIKVLEDRNQTIEAINAEIKRKDGIAIILADNFSYSE